MLIQYYHKRIRKIVRYLYKVSGGFRKKDIHRIRVEIKKLKACLRLLQATDAAFPYEAFFSPFRKLFKKLGNIRELQLQKDHIRSLRTLDSSLLRPYRKQLKKSLKEARKELSKSFCETFVDEVNESKLNFSKVSRVPSTKELDAYFNQIAMKIKTQLSGGASDAFALHKLRILLKEFTYNQQLAHKHLNYEPREIAFEPARAIELQKKLGTLHDTQTVLNQISEQKKEKDWDEDMISHLHTAEMELMERNDALKREVEDDLYYK